MDRKTGYRRFLLWCLGIDLLAIGILGYRYMDRKVPDEIHITRGDRVQEAEIFSHPLLTFEEAVTVSGEGSYLRELMEDLSLLDGREVTLQVQRKGETIPVSISPVKDHQGEYKLGIWVRDDTQGIGTLTFVDAEGNYGALGHGISDVDTGELLDIQDGTLYQAEILGIQKGSKGSPGELSGLIRYEPANIIGKITCNSKNGIYGSYTGKTGKGIHLQQMPVAYKQEMEVGPASILCSIDDKVQEYQAKITKIDMNHEDTNKSFVIQVTDPRLLEKTGGIVQGMSGSPILQNGKVVGAVTHVFVQDSTSGYGIFIENMLEH